MRNLRTDRFFLLLALTSALLSQNCATLLLGTRQTIPVTSTPAGATVLVNGVKQGVTPLELRLARKAKVQVIRIESPGYNPVEIRARRSYSAGSVLANVLGGVVLGLPIGIAISLKYDMKYHGFSVPWAMSAAVIFGVSMIADLGADRAYEFSPSELKVTLTRMEGNPKLNVMLVGADDFRNVKWIRIRRD